MNPETPFRFAMLLAAFLFTSIATAPLHAATALTEQNGKVHKVSPDEFDKARKEKDVVVIDVRSPEEYAAGRIPGAVLVPVSGKGSEAFATKVAEVARGKTPLVYCKSGVRSARAVEKMQALGIKQIIELPGGWVAWTRAEKEVEKGPPPKAPANK